MSHIASSSPLLRAVDAYAVPAVYAGHDAGGWAGGVLGRSAAQQPASWQSHSAMSENGFMFGSAQEPALYRSVLVPRTTYQPHPFSASTLAQPEYQARAVATDMGRSHHPWFQAKNQLAHASSDLAGGFEGFASANKPTPFSQKRADPLFAPELSMPRFESLLVSSPLATALPALPLYLEQTCWSLPHSAMQPTAMWRAVRDQLAQAGVIVAQDEKTHFQLTCSSTIGMSCSEFKVRCFDGHYRECGSVGERASQCYTVEFQRRSGCCLGFMQLFRHMLQCLALVAQVALESQIATAATNTTSDAFSSTPTAAAASVEEPIDLADLDLAALAMPTLARATTEATTTAPTMAADSSLYDSLLGLITSRESAAQIEGMNALALCLDGSHPQAPQLLAEVAAKLRTGQCEQVKQVAAKLLAQASAMPCAAGAVIKHCLPQVLAQLTAPTTIVAGADDGDLSASFASSTAKSLLRSCVSLASSDASGFQGALDGEGSLVASSRFRRELLRMAQSHDEEMRGLAMHAVRTIQV